MADRLAAFITRKECVRAQSVNDTLDPARERWNTIYDLMTGVRGYSMSNIQIQKAGAEAVFYAEISARF
jgi:hypothetical protein